MLIDRGAVNAGQGWFPVDVADIGGRWVILRSQTAAPSTVHAAVYTWGEWGSPSAPAQFGGESDTAGVATRDGGYRWAAPNLFVGRPSLPPQGPGINRSRPPFLESGTTTVTYHTRFGWEEPGPGHAPRAQDYIEKWDVQDGSATRWASVGLACTWKEDDPGLTDMQGMAPNRASLFINDTEFLFPQGWEPWSFSEPAYTNRVTSLTRYEGEWIWSVEEVPSRRLAHMGHVELSLGSRYVAVAVNWSEPRNHGTELAPRIVRSMLLVFDRVTRELASGNAYPEVFTAGPLARGTKVIAYMVHPDHLDRSVRREFNASRGGHVDQVNTSVTSVGGPGTPAYFTDVPRIASVSGERALLMDDDILPLPSFDGYSYGHIAHSGNNLILRAYGGITRTLRPDSQLSQGSAHLVVWRPDQDISAGTGTAKGYFS